MTTITWFKSRRVPFTLSPSTRNSIHKKWCAFFNLQCKISRCKNYDQILYTYEKGEMEREWMNTVYYSRSNRIRRVSRRSRERIPSQGSSGVFSFPLRFFTMFTVDQSNWSRQGCSCSIPTKLSPSGTMSREYKISYLPSQEFQARSLASRKMDF